MTLVKFENDSGKIPEWHWKSWKMTLENSRMTLETFEKYTVKIRERQWKGSRNTLEKFENVTGKVREIHWKNSGITLEKFEKDTGKVR